mmetsp:Transcript_36833/g.113683  ORF Transcript_36833/g.113683 Transcript_36833/m.113683 type:complete len:387 (-) Transcript_36833:108-1268(-)|eukprot:CAMPEP_0174851890 /NCGR_PEP_ID=MMETSP1114-20130205/24394_1 /TAXON_ID=312471 /ORGANISM="Neobodo designis, Strain CCAP 1951/1" /LENGTH=386 /DNA_ID=CAMNT_0016086457 /DNA_START=84 /DNA_END=1244 /DNA_ORIENTATION=+
MSNRNYSKNRRETKREEQPEDAASWAELDTYLEEAASRRAEERAHGTGRLAELFVVAESVTARPTLSEEQVESLLDVTRGALDGRREPDERDQLVRIACTALAWDLLPDGFATDFGEALGAAALEAVRHEETAELAVTMFHAVGFAQAVEGYGLKSGPDTRLAAVMAKEAAGKPQGNWEADLALVRCAALTAVEEEDKPLVCTAIRTRLAKYQDNLSALCQIVRIFAIAVEVHGTGDVLTPASIEEFEEASSKLEGGKEKKKELGQLVRAVVGYIRTGDGPWQTLTLQRGHRADTIEVKLENFVDMAVMDSLRAINGDTTAASLRESALMHALFGIDGGDPDEAHHVKVARLTTEDREARYERLSAAKSRDRGRARARDRKTEAAM